MLTIKHIALLILVAQAAAPAASPMPDLRLPEPLAEPHERDVLPLHLFTDTLRLPFGEDWGGETFLYAPVGRGLSAGVFMRAWSEAICVSPSCSERAIEAGVELRYQVKPGVNLGIGLGGQRTPGARSGPAVLPHVHLKF